MPKTITQYQTHDGKIFDSLEAAQAHEAVLVREASVDEYIAKKYPGENPRFATTTKNIILDWLAFEAAKSLASEEPIAENVVELADAA